MIPSDWLGPWEWQAVRLSLRVAGVAMLASLPFAVAVAWLLARRRFPGHGLLSGIVHLPLVLPPVVTGYLLLLTFGTQGPIGSLLQPFGIVFAFRWTGAALAASAWLAACSQLPTYQRPEVALPSAWPVQASATPAADGTAATEPLAWQDFVREPTLKALIEQADRKSVV